MRRSKRLAGLVSQAYAQALAERPELASADWYADEAAHIVRLAPEHPPILSLGAIALLSPGVDWDMLTDRFPVWLKGGAIPVYGEASIRARRFLETGDPDSFGRRAFKTGAFHANLLGDYGPVTVDRWAARIVGVDPERIGSKRAYGEVARAYVDAARAIGVAPALVQARTWAWIRG